MRGGSDLRAARLGRWRPWAVALGLVALVSIYLLNVRALLEQPPVLDSTSAERDDRAPAALRGDAALAFAPDMKTLEAVRAIVEQRENIRSANAISEPAREATTAPAAAEADVQDTRMRPLMDAEMMMRCFDTRDYGLLDRVRRSGRTFCSDAQEESSDVGSTTASPSQYTYYAGRDANLLATVFDHLTLNLSAATVAGDIPDISHDGHGHDPRFSFQSVEPQCICSSPQDFAHGAPRVWDRVFAHDPAENYSVCNANSSSWGGSGSGAEVLVVPTNGAEHVVALARKDDHNPFFQVSAALNAWLLFQVLGWDPAATQLVYLDKGFPSPVDALQKALLSPKHDVVRGEELLGKVVTLQSVLIAPYEFSGPMMFHLDDDEPCMDNELLVDFRRTALAAMGVADAKADPSSCVVTVISRRPYSGRRVARMWWNEAEILSVMRKAYARNGPMGPLGVYKLGECVFQSVDFVDLTIGEQMRLMVESDVVVGMHGAGMVNVMWTRPGTLVIEIFPTEKRRWGYRNLCQHLGCDWHEFRGGWDVHGEDKVVSYAEWTEFFDPLFRQTVSDLERSLAK